MSRIPRVKELGSVPLGGVQAGQAPNVNGQLGQISSILGQITGLVNQGAGLFQQQAKIEERKAEEIQKDFDKAMRVDRGAAAELVISVRGTVVSQIRQGGYDDIIPIVGDAGAANVEIVDSVRPQGNTEAYNETFNLRLGPPALAAILARQRELQVRGDKATIALAEASLNGATTEAEVNAVLSGLDQDLLIPRTPEERAVMRQKMLNGFAFSAASDRDPDEASRKEVRRKIDLAESMGAGPRAMFSANSRADDIDREIRNTVYKGITDEIPDLMDQYRVGDKTKDEVVNAIRAIADKREYGVDGSPEGEKRRIQQLQDGVRRSFGGVDTAILKEQAQANRMGAIRGNIESAGLLLLAPGGRVASTSEPPEYWDPASQEFRPVATKDEWLDMVQSHFLATLTGRFDTPLPSGFLTGGEDMTALADEQNARNFLIQFDRRDPQFVESLTGQQAQALARSTRENMFYRFLQNGEMLNKNLVNDMASVRRLLELPDLNMASLTADRGDGRSILDYFRLAQKMDRFKILSGHMQDNLTTTFVRAVLEMERQSISTIEESIVNGARWRERYEDLNVETNENRETAVFHLKEMGFGSVEPTSNLVSDFLDTTKFMIAMRPKTGFAGAAALAAVIFPKNTIIVGDGYTIDIGMRGHALPAVQVQLVDRLLREHHIIENPDAVTQELKNNPLNAHLALSGPPGNETITLGKFGGMQGLRNSLTMTFDEFKAIVSYADTMDNNAQQGPLLDQAQENWDRRKEQLERAVLFDRVSTTMGGAFEPTRSASQIALKKHTTKGRPTKERFGVQDVVIPKIDQDNKLLVKFVEFVGNQQNIIEMRRIIERAEGFDVSRGHISGALETDPLLLIGQ